MTAGAVTFEQFWAWYPRKVGKQRARRAFSKALHRLPPAAEIRAALDRYKANLAGWSDHQICHPSTWLNQWRWQDEFPSRSTPAAPEDPEVARWKLRLEGYGRNRFWLPDHWGPAPNEPGCKAPAHLMPETLRTIDRAA